MSVHNILQVEINNSKYSIVNRRKKVWLQMSISISFFVCVVHL